MTPELQGTPFTLSTNAIVSPPGELFSLLAAGVSREQLLHQLGSWRATVARVWILSSPMMDSEKLTFVVISFGEKDLEDVCHCGKNYLVLTDT